MQFNKKTTGTRVSPPLKTVDPAEVLAAGGPDAYAKKVGKEHGSEKIAGIIPMTDEEYEAVLKQLERD